MFGWFKKKQNHGNDVDQELLFKLHEAIEKDIYSLKEAITDKVSAVLESSSSKQVLILEDIFDTLEENKINDSTKSNDDVKKLCSIIVKFNEYFYQIERQTSTDINSTGKSWNEQIQLIRRDMKQHMRLAGIDEIIEIDIKADTRLHQVIGTDVTKDAAKDTLIKDIIIPGYIYKGDVLQKAKVIIYKKEVEYVKDNWN